MTRVGLTSLLVAAALVAAVLGQQKPDRPIQAEKVAGGLQGYYDEMKAQR